MNPEDRQTERTRIVAAAYEWLGTPYHPGGRVKGAGVDCLTLLAEVYAEAGMTERITVPYYPHDWHLHRGRELYLEGMMRHAREMAGPPEPGDIALWRFGRCFSHGAIVVDWPDIIHAYVGRAVTLENAENALWLSQTGKNRPRSCRFFTVF